VKQYRNQGTTSIIHGKAWHEETKATVSQAHQRQGRHALSVVFTLARPITSATTSHGRRQGGLPEEIRGRLFAGFDPDVHLVAVGVANQTTMMKGRNGGSAAPLSKSDDRSLRPAGPRQPFPKAGHHLRRDPGTAGRALRHARPRKMNLLLVVGGYNSSKHVAPREMGEAVRPTLLHQNSDKLTPRQDNLPLRPAYSRMESCQHAWLPEGNVVVGITAGASCPKQYARGDHPSPSTNPRRQRGEPFCPPITAKSSASSPAPTATDIIDPISGGSDSRSDPFW